MSALRTHFTFRVDTWTPDGKSIVEHVAGVEDYQVALATYRAACERCRHTHHLAARCPSDRGQPPARGVQSVRAPLSALPMSFSLEFLGHVHLHPTRLALVLIPAVQGNGYFLDGNSHFLDARSARHGLD